MCGYQGVRNIGFSENFAYVLKKRSLGMFPAYKITIFGRNGTEYSIMDQFKFFKTAYKKFEGLWSA